MPTSAAEKRHFRRIGHSLKPIVSFGGKGLTTAFLEELNRALEDHELVKLKVHCENRDDRKAIISAVIEETPCELIQSIGNTALLYRPAKRPNPKLSNLLRYNND